MLKLTPPTPPAILAARKAAGLGQKAAGEAVFVSLRTWQQWEYGESTMHLAFWMLFHHRVTTISTPRQLQHTNPHLTLEQCVNYADALRQSRASFALEGMQPQWDDEVIEAAIMAGLVSPDQYKTEMLAYVYERKTLNGFIESRPWAKPLLQTPELLAA
jgi:DNA-binding XRE family transcriptional regulator